MLVKAKWNVTDSAGIHKAGDVWDTKEDLGDNVEVLEMPKAEPKPVKKQEKPAEEVKAEPKPKAASRKRKISG